MRSDLLSKRFFGGFLGLPWLWIVHVLYFRGNQESDEGLINPENRTSFWFHDRCMHKERTHHCFCFFIILADFQDEPAATNSDGRSAEEIHREAAKWVSRCQTGAAIVIPVVAAPLWPKARCLLQHTRPWWTPSWMFITRSSWMLRFGTLYDPTTNICCSEIGALPMVLSNLIDWCTFGFTLSISSSSDSDTSSSQSGTSWMIRGIHNNKHAAKVQPLRLVRLISCFKKRRTSTTTCCGLQQWSRWHDDTMTRRATWAAV